MNPFKFSNPTKILFGRGQVEEIKNEIPSYGRRVLLLYGGGSIKKNGMYDQVIKALSEITDVHVVELSGVEPNPRLTTVNKGIDLVKDNNLDFILAVGGGSVIDCAKAIAVGVYYEGDVWDIVTNKAAAEKAVPFGAILTISATGSEVNGGSVITNWEEKDKRFFVSDLTFPKFSVLDPENTFSVPKNQTVYGMVDIMSHVFEQYFHASSNAPLQERFGESILQTTMEAAPKLINDLGNYDYREVIMLNASLALNGILSMGVQTDWATHMIEHAVSAVHDIPHGGGLAILFPNWMEFVASKRPEKVAQLGIRVFGIDAKDKNDSDVAAETIQKLREFWTSLGAPEKLSDYGIDDTEIGTMLERAMVAETLGSYVPLNKNDVETILRKSL
ncbi:iron-containing alcohol dehydrogenase [Paenibacillus sabinae]|uniref:Iron-containing alcohol dehydrogenase n=1 Tax=Paenibacillus sabinae T27 TaxID=1268072 RepID=X5A4R4_9BACL|nr:iron-containing alcohol dehydrogenase [Paenibacillus sabinae]AHV98779.1 iron-containing alcohol dehydrogenase [Paenibacillus sabinae T27]